jgi:hypothetical protein
MPAGSAEGASKTGPFHTEVGVLSMSYSTEHTPATAADRRDVDLPRHHFAEAKEGFKTSEFYVMTAFVAVVLLATYLGEDSLARDDGWRYAAFAVVAYIISRGLAKLGVRHPSDTDE